ncbi:hypothetical protein FQN57_005592 [Myotisia sp. PD_48]|nr:hypothetical protein FQN57_005592 [Myotisia sp. PD_48]
MLGLGAYESSSEDEDRQKSSEIANPAVSLNIPTNHALSQPGNAIPPQPGQIAPTTEQSTNPILGPLPPPEDYTSTSNPSEISSILSIDALRRDMTLPPFPNLDIPPSPPGSPDPEANKKFAHFLTLKKNGVHFNEKLASSSSLKNPSLLQTLMEHSGFTEQDQYTTSLPSELWDVSKLPPWGFKDELYKNQQEISRKIEEEKKPQRDAIEFVPSTSSGGSAKIQSNTVERVMAGLNREPSPAKSEQSRRSDFERRRRA